jgi:hypothetical protein
LRERTPESCPGFEEGRFAWKELDEMRALTAGLFALMLSAPTLAATPYWANPFNQKIMNLKQADRDGALRRAITDNNQRCGRLTHSRYRGPYGNLGTWVARCTPGGDYAIYAGPDGSVQVRKCADLKDLKLPECGKLD